MKHMINVGTFRYNVCLQNVINWLFFTIVSKKGRFFRPDLATNGLTMKIVLFFLTIAREILRVWH